MSDRGPSRRLFATRMGALSVLLAAPDVFAATRRRKTQWPDGRRAAVSLTYDDGLDSQLDNAAPKLDALGLKATFFVTQENMDARLADWVALGGRGHEIADHTVSHPCELRKYSGDEFQQREILPMERYLDANFGAGPARAFAYPCGMTELGDGPVARRRSRYLSLMRANFAFARTVGGDPNDPRRLGADRYRLHAFEPTYDRDQTELAMAYVNMAIARGDWAILIFHEVLPQRLGEGDTSIAVHGAILDWIMTQPVWCAPLSTVTTYIERA